MNLSSCLRCETVESNDATTLLSGLRLARDAGQIDTHADARNTFAADVIAGLSARHKRLPPKYFYDAVGSRLFEEICGTEDYYITRSETALLRKVAPELAADIPAGAVLVELGSGDSTKTRLLLDAAPQLSAYVPIDISADALGDASALLARDYPALNIVPVVADFTRRFSLPAAAVAHPRVGFFPGSTIGNFDRDGAVRFLRSVRQVLGDDAVLLVGVDLVKDPSILRAAYDDSGGVTARFNRNALLRINRELRGNFDVEAFSHLALWNTAHCRMEMYLVSRKDQIVSAAGHTFAFRAGEPLHTENSHKFTVETFTSLAADGGWSVSKTWLSEAPQVALFRLEPTQQRGNR